MSKIIKITDDKVLIGTDKGEIKEASISSLSFVPELNQEVELFEDETTLVVMKKTSTNQSIPNGININLQNNQTVPNQVYVQNKKVVNKVIYCVLAFFLGGIGIHKMYAGYIGAGIVYLLFCWTLIPGIVAFIEFISALCKSSDEYGNIMV